MPLAELAVELIPTHPCFGKEPLLSAAKKRKQEEAGATELTSRQ
jgi:hypothetical protein